MDINLQEMENKQEYYSCFQYYNDKRRRLSCFSRKLNNDELEMWIWTCDRRDMFNRKLARTMYSIYINGGTPQLLDFAAGDEYGKVEEIHPQIFTIPLDGKHPKKAFLDYLADNYYKPYPIWKVVRHVYLNKQQRDEAFQLINSML